MTNLCSDSLGTVSRSTSSPKGGSVLRVSKHWKPFMLPCAELLRKPGRTLGKRGLHSPEGRCAAARPPAEGRRRAEPDLWPSGGRGRPPALRVGANKTVKKCFRTERTHFKVCVIGDGEDFFYFKTESPDRRSWLWGMSPQFPDHESQFIFQNEVYFL